MILATKTILNVHFEGETYTQYKKLFTTMTKAAKFYRINYWTLRSRFISKGFYEKDGLKIEKIE